MTKQALLERVTVVAALLVLAAAVWFWSEQIADVLETLALAYGED
ncbi:MAG: hypothetical protein ACR2PZ_26930 [Pseudomonadales bacterium]